MRSIVAAGVNGIAPRDEMEGMIAAQMLACHDTAMGCFRDALNSKLHGRLWHEYLEQAGKLTRAFAMLLDAQECGACGVEIASACASPAIAIPQPFNLD
jgi:hypothetical protein